MSEQVIAYVGLGSNLDNPRQQLHRAFQALDGIEGSRVLARSALYRSPPLGPSDQPDYLNAVAGVETRLAPTAFLAALQRIETAQGRVRKQRWGPRTLDLDLLVYGDRVVDSPALTVPHPGIAARAFVLYPLAEIAPGLVVPGLGPLSELIGRCAPGGLEKLLEREASAQAVDAGDHVHTR